MDEDPWSVQPPHLKKFEEKQDLANYKFKIFHHASKNNVLIILCPRLEEWILGAAKEVDVDLKAYDLPNEAVKLHEQINIQIDNFQKLLEDIKDRSNRIKTLKEHLVGGKTVLDTPPDLSQGILGRIIDSPSPS